MYKTIRKVAKDMVETTRGVIPHRNALRTISDEALDDIIRNTQANQASLTQLYNTLINERVRRRLKLPDDRQGDLYRT